MCLHAAAQISPLCIPVKQEGFAKIHVMPSQPCPCIHLKSLLLTIGCNSQNQKETAFYRGLGIPKSTATPAYALFSKDAGIVKERPRTVGTSSWAWTPGRGTLRHRPQRNGTEVEGGAVFALVLVKMCQLVAARCGRDPGRAGQSSACWSSSPSDEPGSDGWLTSLR